MCFLDPRCDRLSGPLGQLEADWQFGFLLSDTRSGKHMVAVSDVEHPEADQIASAEFAVEDQVEEREFTGLPCHLKASPNGPDCRELERRFLPNELSFVPGSSSSRERSV
jgi:hypothetical protein